MNQKRRESSLNMDEGRANKKSVEDLLREGKLAQAGVNKRKFGTAVVNQPPSSEAQPES